MSEPGTSEPRIAPLPRAEWTDEVMQAIVALRPPEVTQELPRRKGQGRNVLGTLARHPKLMHAYHTFNGHIIFTTTLTPRQRELLVLRVAAVRDAEYEWKQHVVLAAEAGLDDEEIARVAEGGDAPGWSPVEAAMVRAVDELISDAKVIDTTWEVLAGTFDDQQLMDIVFTVGAYDVLAMAFRSFEIQLDEDRAQP